MISENKILELYIHIPFCVRKCNYCDFLSSPADRGTQEAYMAALFSEIVGRAAEYQEYQVVSVFIGGGTPSVVETKWIVQLMELVRENYQLVEDTEITMEVNPGTVNAGMLDSYYEAGINRLSIGLQSANDRELKKLGRIHTFAQFKETYAEARAAGFTNINVDVMSALPGQNRESYQDTLRQLLALTPQPEHISAYSLIVEEGTPFAEWEEKGMLDVPDEDCERLMYEDTKQILGEAGYCRYEISNYAKEGFACRHNCGYWQRVEYVGFGIGAASMVQNGRFSNDSNLQKYLKDPMNCRSKVQVLSVEEQMEEFMFLGLRMTVGVSEQEFLSCFGRTLSEVYGEVIEQNIQDGLLYYRTVIRKAEDAESEEEESFLALTARGADLSNYVMAQFLFDGD